MAGPEIEIQEQANPRVIIADGNVFITDSQRISVQLSEDEAADVMGALFDHFSIEIGKSRKLKDPR